MAKIGRNDPCPCGSGKKYKKCCLSKTDEAQATAGDDASLAQGETDGFLHEAFELDALSNSIVDLIGQGKLLQAEKACADLLRKYPDDIDGLERYAQLCEAKGDFSRAVKYNQKANQGKVMTPNILI